MIVAFVVRPHAAPVRPCFLPAAPPVPRTGHAMPPRAKTTEKLLYPTPHLSQHRAVHRTVDYLRSTVRFTRRRVHNDSVVPNPSPTAPPISTVCAQVDDPAGQRRHHVVPNVHNTYYCY